MLETPVTSDEVVTWFLSNLPAYKSAVSPVTRGVEIGLAHGFFISGPWIKVYKLGTHLFALFLGLLSNPFALFCYVSM